MSSLTPDEPIILTEPLPHSLFDNATYSDLTIICGTHQWSVHKSIVCERCEWFAAATKHDMKANDTFNMRLLRSLSVFQEAASQTITLDERDPHVAEVVLRHLYGFDYHACTEAGYAVFEPILFNIQVYIAADFFGLPGLQELVGVEFKALAKSAWSHGGFRLAVEAVAAYPSADRLGELRQSLVKVDAFHKIVSPLNTIATMWEAGPLPEKFKADVLGRALKARLHLENYVCDRCLEPFAVTTECSKAKAFYCPTCGQKRDGTAWQTYRDQWTVTPRKTSADR